MADITITLGKQEVKEALAEWVNKRLPEGHNRATYATARISGSSQLGFTGTVTIRLPEPEEQVKSKPQKSGRLDSLQLDEEKGDDDG